MTVEIMFNRGFGPLLLGMSPAEVAAVAGPPKSVEDPMTYDFMLDELKPFQRDQLIESRKPNAALPVIDLHYWQGRLAAISIDGKSSEAVLDGHPLTEPRAVLLNHLASLDSDILINAESYYFRSLGIIATRQKTRKDINYVRVVDRDFLEMRRFFERYKPHSGKLIP
ncbi:hypothetical protein [Bosea sp. (in: a-proteobacteria)]|uniref:hypothetical protein n=1 Tax=Bosea sp. (in: a-proteobacteria) TaxID=1871050 RepID=UPI003B3ACAC7